MSTSGFTLFELLAVMALLSLLIAAQTFSVADNARLVKLQSALLYAQTWANEADRTRRSGIVANGKIEDSLLAARRVAPVYSPFDTAYYATVTAANARVSFQVPFLFSHALVETSVLDNGHTQITVAADIDAPALAAVEKYILYQETFI